MLYLEGKVIAQNKNKASECFLTAITKQDCHTSLDLISIYKLHVDDDQPLSYGDFKVFLSYVNQLRQVLKNGSPTVSTILGQFSQELLKTDLSKDPLKFVLARRCFYLAYQSYSADALYQFAITSLTVTQTPQENQMAALFLRVCVEKKRNGLEATLSRIDRDFGDKDGVASYLLGWSYWTTGYRGVHNESLLSSREFCFNSALHCFEHASEKNGDAAYMYVKILRQEAHMLFGNSSADRWEPAYYSADINNFSPLQLECKIMVYLEKAHNGGHQTAIFELGQMYEKRAARLQGEEQKKTFAKAFTCYELSLKRELNKADHQIAKRALVALRKALELSDNAFEINLTGEDGCTESTVDNGD